MSSPQNPGQSSTGSTQEVREGPSSEQQGLSQKGSIILLWIVACAIGGMLGGFGRTFEMLFFVPLFGGLLGVAQGLVLRRYLPRGTGLWILASFLGWFAGEIARITLVEAFPEVGTAISEAISSERFGPPYGLDPLWVYEPVVWAVFGLAQSLVLLAVLRLRSPGLVALWVAASSLGGVFFVAFRYFGIPERFMAPGEGAGGGILGEFLFMAGPQAALGALYGIATGLVLVRVVRRVSSGGTETHPPMRSRGPSWYRRRGLRIVAGLLALLGLVFVGVWGIKELTGLGCNRGERAVLKEFPHYGDQQIEPYSAEVSCNAKYVTDAPRDEVLGYYDDRLRENGWEVGGFWAANPPQGVEVFGEQLSDISEAPEEGIRSGMDARRGDYSYGVTYQPPGESPEVSPDQAEVMVAVTDEPPPPGAKGGYPK